MNRNAGNALLKILEEPPRRTLLLLVAHSAGRLLPTIRSRCRHMKLSALPPATVRQLLGCYAPEVDESQAAVIVDLAGGSIGRALELAASGGVDLHKTMVSLLSRRGGLDPLAMHGFADRLVRADAEDSYRAVEELLRQHLAWKSVQAARAGRGREAANWAVLHNQIGNDFARADGLNLDRKQTILSAFFAIERAVGTV